MIARILLPTSFAISMGSGTLASMAANVSGQAVDKGLTQSIALSGETVTITYSADPKIGYGRFLLTNTSQQAIVASVTSVWLETGDERHSIADAQLFDPNQGQSGIQLIDAQHLEIAPGIAATFDISFVPIPYEPPFGRTVAIGLQLGVDDATFAARSPLQYIRRWPPGQP